MIRATDTRNNKQSKGVRTFVAYPYHTRQIVCIESRCVRIQLDRNPFFNRRSFFHPHALSLSTRNRINFEISSLFPMEYFHFYFHSIEATKVRATTRTHKIMCTAFWLQLFNKSYRNIHAAMPIDIKQSNKTIGKWQNHARQPKNKFTFFVACCRNTRFYFATLL